MTRKEVEFIENIKKYGIIYADPPWRYTKVGATAVVMVYNFITRKIFLEQQNIITAP